jgi:Flp pilus assembly protein TadD
MTASQVAQLTPEARALKQQIDEKLAKLERLDMFAILGLRRDATKEQVRAAYLTHAKTFHPDRLASFKLTPLRADVERIFARLSEAQAMLLDDRRRHTYLEKLDGAAHGSAAKAHQLLEAERVFQQGEAALRSRQYALAEEHFRQSVELNPEEGEHHALLAWAMFQNPAHVRAAISETVKQGLTRAIKLSRNNPRPYYLIGEVFLAENDLDRAVGSFRRALELKDGYVDAERGLRLASMRREKTTDRKGLFDRFRKK